MYMYTVTSAIPWRSWRCRTDALQTCIWLTVAVSETAINQSTTMCSPVVYQSPLEHSSISGSNRISTNSSCWCRLTWASTQPEYRGHVLPVDSFCSLFSSSIFHTCINFWILPLLSPFQITLLLTSFDFCKIWNDIWYYMLGLAQCYLESILVPLSLDESAHIHADGDMNIFTNNEWT